MSCGSECSVSVCGRARGAFSCSRDQAGSAGGRADGESVRRAQGARGSLQDGGEVVLPGPAGSHPQCPAAAWANLLEGRCASGWSGRSRITGSI
jgi:hypothetical protein